MKAEAIITTILTKVKDHLQNHADDSRDSLNISSGVMAILSSA
jgi:hypothetical protein